MKNLIPSLRCVAAFLLLLTALGSWATAAEGRRLNVLMLGHKVGMHSGHITEERFAQLFQALGPRGIDLEFTDDPNYALNAQTLAHFDALALYANLDKITPEQEKALFDYVESGHGFVPIHCASYCFLNSMKCTELMGGRFKRHNTGDFETTVVMPEHEIMKGFKPFKTWDETYVHEMHNPDKIILQRRVDASKNEDEPWTWVRTQGKGRVFYTAYGHDQRTWGEIGFQDLIFRGIKWAVGEAAAADFAKLKLAPLEYVEGAEVPNYEKRSPAPKLQKPLSPADAQSHIFKPAAMNLNLFASEADAEGGLWNVIEFKFDEQGRMWTCESRDYPNEIKLQGEGRDRIRILEDTNGDGKADKFTVFAEGISIPTSLVFYNGGIIVTSVPNTTFFKDTNGDGKSDESKVLFSGWGTNDTHATCSSLEMGFDGWVYGSVGYSGFDGDVAGKRVKFTMGAYRFLPDGSKLEYLGQTSNNTWGFCFTENGDIFGSTANNQSSWYCPIPRRYYDSVPGLEQGILPGVDANKKVNFMREYIRQVDVFGGFTAAACHNFYTARSFPQRYWNATAFIAEPTCHVLYQGTLTFDGASASIGNGGNLLASDDEWFAPVYANVGPDGSVYVSDFYSFIIQHNPTPSADRGGFKATTGKGNAFVSDLRDVDHARLWKITAKDGKPSQTYKLSVHHPDVLLQAITSDNQLWRKHAQRLLVQRANKDVVPQLKTLLADPKLDAIGTNGAAYASLWTLAGLGEADLATVTKALAHPATGVQRSALKLLSRDAAGLAALQASNLLTSKDTLVKLDALLALSEMPATTAVGADLFAATSTEIKDRWLPTATTVAAARHAEGFLAAALKADTSEVKASTVAPKNLLPNADFEAVQGALPKDWHSTTHGGKGEFTVDSSVSHGGHNSLRISSQEGGDLSWSTEVPLEANSGYILSGWIKTDKLETTGGGKGAMLELHQLNGKQPATKPLKATSDWTHFELPFASGPQKSVVINLLYGGWGMATGSAWWDDVQLIKVGGGTQSDGQILQVANAFIRGNPTAQTVLAPLLATSKGRVSKIITDALAAGGASAKKEDINDLKKTHNIVKVQIVAGQMKYDKVAYDVKGDKPIAILLYNPDVLQHNLVAGKPGSIDKIGAAATEMVTKPDGLNKSFIPEITEVLGGTPFANPNELLILKLSKLEKGEYPLVCTFPGHWLLMRAVLKVE